MAIQLQLRKGTKVQNDAFTGAEGELTYDSTTKTVRVHDGITQGGVGFVDLVVDFQAPTAENNYTWYRKYKSGWVEQGGCLLNAATGAHTITIPIEMASVDELKKSAITTPIYISGTIQDQGVTVRNSNDSSWSTTQIDFYSLGATIHIKWQVSGMAAE